MALNGPTRSVLQGFVTSVVFAVSALRYLPKSTIGVCIAGIVLAALDVVRIIR